MMSIRKILVFGMALTLLTAGLAFGAEPIKIGCGAAAVHRRRARHPLPPRGGNGGGLR